MQKKIDTLRDILLDNKCFTAFELYTLEIVEKLFKQLRNETAVQYLETPNASDAIMTTRWRAKGSLALLIAELSPNGNHLKILYAKRTIG